MTNHTRFCNDQFKKHDKIVTEYEKKWPNYCKKCNGWGGFWSQYDPSPAGIALAPGYMLDFEPCDQCIEEGICPRCGQTSSLIELDVEDGDDIICPNCNWKSDNNCQDMSEMWGLPQPPVCMCELETELKQLYGR